MPQKPSSASQMPDSAQVRSDMQITTGNVTEAPVIDNGKFIGYVRYSSVSEGSLGSSNASMVYTPHEFTADQWYARDNISSPFGAASSGSSTSGNTPSSVVLPNSSDLTSEHGGGVGNTQPNDKVLTDAISGGRPVTSNTPTVNRFTQTPPGLSGPVGVDNNSNNGPPEFYDDAGFGKLTYTGKKDINGDLVYSNDDHNTALINPTTGEREASLTYMILGPNGEHVTSQVVNGSPFIEGDKVYAWDGKANSWQLTSGITNSNLSSNSGPELISEHGAGINPSSGGKGADVSSLSTSQRGTGSLDIPNKVSGSYSLTDKQVADFGLSANNTRTLSSASTTTKPPKKQEEIVIIPVPNGGGGAQDGTPVTTGSHKQKVEVLTPAPGGSVFDINGVKAYVPSPNQKEIPKVLPGGATEVLIGVPGETTTFNINGQKVQVHGYEPSADTRSLTSIGGIPQAEAGAVATVAQPDTSANYFENNVSADHGEEKPAGDGIGVQKSLDEVTSPGYKGQTDATKTYAYTDAQGNDNTLTFQPNGVVVQTKEDGSSFTVWNPDNNNGEHWPGFASRNITDPYAGQVLSGNSAMSPPANLNNMTSDAASGGGYAASDPPASDNPAWHTNPNWGGPDSDKVASAGLDPSQVLEERPGANGNTIFRLSDGTYQSYNPSTGQTNGAGTWDASAWNNSQYANNGTAGVAPPDQLPPINNVALDPASQSSDPGLSSGDVNNFFGPSGGGAPAPASPSPLPPINIVTPDPATESNDPGLASGDVNNFWGPSGGYTPPTVTPTSATVTDTGGGDGGGSSSPDPLPPINYLSPDEQAAQAQDPGVTLPDGQQDTQPPSGLGGLSADPNAGQQWSEGSIN